MLTFCLWGHFLLFFLLFTPSAYYIKQQMDMTLNANSLPTKLLLLSPAFGGKKKIPFIPVKSKPIRKSDLSNNI